MRVCDVLIANFVLAILALWIGSFLILIFVDKADQIPTMTFSAIAAGFAYQAYKYTKEKFRLELFEKRWEVYVSTIEFLGIYSKHGTLKATNENREDIGFAWEAASKSFRGIGFHKYKLLFGDDIHLLFTRVNKVFGYEASFESTHNTERWLENATFLTDLSSQMPEKFAPYLYFGDYKSNQQQEKNLCELCVSAVKTIGALRKR